jgi:hypothetical protein
MTVKELRQKLFDIEDQDAKVLMNVNSYIMPVSNIRNIPIVNSVIIEAYDDGELDEDI